VFFFCLLAIGGALFWHFRARSADSRRISIPASFPYALKGRWTAKLARVFPPRPIRLRPPQHAPSVAGGLVKKDYPGWFHPNLRQEYSVEVEIGDDNRVTQISWDETVSIGNHTRITWRDPTHWEYSRKPRFQTRAGGQGIDFQATRDGSRLSIQAENADHSQLPRFTGKWEKLPVTLPPQKTTSGELSWDEHSKTALATITWYFPEVPRDTVPWEDFSFRAGDDVVQNLFKSTLSAMGGKTRLKSAYPVELKGLMVPGCPGDICFSAQNIRVESDAGFGKFAAVTTVHRMTDSRLAITKTREESASILLLFPAQGTPKMVTKAGALEFDLEKP
jgi:hypothetical protein